MGLNTLKSLAYYRGTEDTEMKPSDILLGMNV